MLIVHLYYYIMWFVYMWFLGMYSLNVDYIAGPTFLYKIVLNKSINQHQMYSM